jgi:hypothetical protein
MSKIDKLEARPDGIGHLLADRYIVVPPYEFLEPLLLPSRPFVNTDK